MDEQLEGRVSAIVITVALVVAVSAGTLLTPAAHASVFQILSVLVTNTAENPVSVALVGTPSLALAGTPSVSIAGTPSVAITGNGREPVQGETVLGGTDEDCRQIYQVPAGKRLVVEYVSVEAFGLIPTNHVAVRLNAFKEAAQVNIPIAPTLGRPHLGSEMVQFFSTTDLRVCSILEAEEICDRPGIVVSWSGISRISGLPRAHQPQGWAYSH